jgi:hypothetical protein
LDLFFNLFFDFVRCSSEFTEGLAYRPSYLREFFGPKDEKGNGENVKLAPPNP